MLNHTPSYNQWISEWIVSTIQPEYKSSLTKKSFIFGSTIHHSCILQWSLFHTNECINFLVEPHKLSYYIGELFLFWIFTYGRMLQKSKLLCYEDKVLKTFKNKYFEYWFNRIILKLWNKLCFSNARHTSLKLSPSPTPIHTCAHTVCQSLFWEA